MSGAITPVPVAESYLVQLIMIFFYHGYTFTPARRFL